MIHNGSDLKFMVTATADVLSLEKHAFTVTVRNRWGQTTASIGKEEMFRDADGRYYFTLEGMTAGVYFAHLTCEVPDGDYDKLTRTVTDDQWLCTVGCCHPAGGTCGHSEDWSGGCGCGHVVAYEQAKAKVDALVYAEDSDIQAIFE